MLESKLVDYCGDARKAKIDALLEDHIVDGSINVLYDHGICFKLAIRNNRSDIFAVLLKYYQDSKLCRDGHQNEYHKNLVALREVFKDILQKSGVPVDIIEQIHQYLPYDKAAILKTIKHKASTVGLRIPCLDDLDQMLGQEEDGAELGISYIQNVLEQLKDMKNSLEATSLMHIANRERQDQIISKSIELLESQYNLPSNTRDLGDAVSLDSGYMSAWSSDSPSVQSIAGTKSKLSADDFLRNAKLGDQDQDNLESAEILAESGSGDNKELLRSATPDANEFPQTVVNISSPISRVPSSKDMMRSINVKTIGGFLSGFNTLREKVNALHEKTLTIHNRWTYVYYNELAKETYKYSLELRAQSKIQASEQLIDDSIAYITQARSMINGFKIAENGHIILPCKEIKNPYYKSVVFYNYSQFIIVTGSSRPGSTPEADAMNAINTAIDLCKMPDDLKFSDDHCNVLQDCILHKAFILSSSDSDQTNHDEIAELYKEAFILDSDRFVREYTKDGKGSELVFWALSNSLMDVFDRMLEMKAQGKLTTLDVNISNEFGVSPLLAALFGVDCDLHTKYHMIEQLIALGADPLACSEEVRSPLFHALQSCYDSGLISVLLSDQVITQIKSGNTHDSGEMHELLKMLEIRRLHHVTGDSKIEIGSDTAAHFYPVYDVNNIRGMILGDIDDGTSVHLSE